jgi:hypothetical protein
VNIEITPQVQRVIDLAYPGMSPRQQANQVRNLIHDVLLERVTAVQGPELPFETIPDPEEASKKIANRIADMAPAIDDQNWAAIRRGVTRAQEQSLWDNPTELRLVARLNDEFEGAINEHRVQKSRITAFFDRLL